ncbi:MAG TPA: MBL fold metallo-hydrolase [Actinomycetota bacterium]|nr:MBL fold metallo-hydrolase [Actinomycetota bacterium]
MQVLTIETPGLGDRSYLAHDGHVALVVDPQRDIDRVLTLAESAGVTITHVAETHVHNDYLSGGLDLARRTGASYLVSAEDGVEFDRLPVADGMCVEVGGLKVQAIGTPGHTHNHLSYLVFEQGRAQALFTGGSLLYGTVGRTDLASEEESERLTRDQFRSARKLASLVPDEVEIWPTHGFGSFCSSGRSSGALHATMGQERKSNLALTMQDEDEFVSTLLSGLTAYPRYYAYMAPINLAGPEPVDLTTPRQLDAEQLRSQIRAGRWVVDLGKRRAYARGHLPGTVSVELGKSFATYLGWVLPWGTPLTLVGDSMEEVAQAQRELVRIGIDRLEAAAGERAHLAGELGLAAYPVSDFSELAAVLAADHPPLVLDVRRHDERAGGSIAGSVHVPLQDLVGSLEQLPSGPIWVHCASGFRASIAASLLSRGGKQVVLIDDEWARASGSGVRVVGKPAAG